MTRDTITKQLTPLGICREIMVKYLIRDVAAPKRLIKIPPECMYRETQYLYGTPGQPNVTWTGIRTIYQVSHEIRACIYPPVDSILIEEESHNDDRVT